MCKINKELSFCLSRLAKSITNSYVSNEDINLDADLWVMYGWANNKQPGGALGKHASTPKLTSSRINVVTSVSGSDTSGNGTSSTDTSGNDTSSTGTSSSVTIAATSLMLALLAAIAVFVNKEY